MFLSVATAIARPSDDRNKLLSAHRGARLGGPFRKFNAVFMHRWNLTVKRSQHSPMIGIYANAAFDFTGANF